MEAISSVHSLDLENQRRVRLLKKQILLCPGPVMVSEHVKTALLHPDIGHREPEFSALLKRARAKLSLVFGVIHPDEYATVVINGSGSAANESVISSLGEGRKILVLSNGEFGERLAELSECHELELTHLKYPWGTPIPVAEVERAIAAHDPDVVAMVHHETSTGMLNPIQKIGALTHQAGKWLFVDAVSSLAAEWVDVERNHIDLCTSSSNKALSSCTGLSFVCGRRAVFESLKHVRCRTKYLNLYRHYQMETELAQTPNTPSLTVLFALDAALDELLERGLTNQIHRTRAHATLLREGLRAMGLSFVIPEHHMSNVLTTVAVPEGVDYQAIKDRLKERGYLVYGGKGPLTDKAFQVANIGMVKEQHLHDFLRDLQWILSVLSASDKPEPKRTVEELPAHA